jgi:hypothetical protein
VFGGWGELVDAFEQRAMAIAASAAAPNTRRAYATAYRWPDPLGSVRSV